MQKTKILKYKFSKFFIKKAICHKDVFHNQNGQFCFHFLMIFLKYFFISGGTNDQILCAKNEIDSIP